MNWTLQGADIKKTTEHKYQVFLHFQIPALEKFKSLVNRIRNVVSFELSKEMEKDVFRLVTSARQMKNFQSP